jgi:hypothetical protein
MLSLSLAVYSSNWVPGEKIYLSRPLAKVNLSRASEGTRGEIFNRNADSNFLRIWGDFYSTGKVGVKNIHD